jgi:hypothetical protein
MLNFIGEALSLNALGLAPASYAAGANNGGWVDVRNVEGQIVVLLNVGAVTGNVVFSLQDATDGSGTGAAALTPAVATAAITTASTAHRLVVPAGSVRGWIRVVATVTTGPVFAGANVAGYNGTAP